MLHYKTIEPATLELLKALLAIPEFEYLRLASIKDICAMKLAAVAGRGTKKDFIDVYFLLQHYSLQEMLRLYKEKYTDGSTFMIIKSLSYFDDAEDEPEPFMFENIDWDMVKQTILKELSSLSLH